VVVSAEHDDVALESAFTLVEVVGEVTSDVRGFTVALDNDAVFVITERSGAQPGGAIGFEDVAEFAQASNGAVNSAWSGMKALNDK